ncbi:hypothetical protein [Chromobacterium sp. CV08]|uniref:hypothetical protein n=1 Tax=Chromobacterium sp. CV08 TaxID=3133274 RepID=UPI003DA8B58E
MQKKDMWPAIKDLPPRKQEAVLVTYFKQGPVYFKRFLAKNKGLPSNKIQAGEGCRTCYQRKKIGQAMGIDVDSLEPAK